MEDYRQKAHAQLGTVGSGNHYVDLMRDEDGLVWIGVHFGSRGLGHTSATRYLKAAISHKPAPLTVSRKQSRAASRRWQMSIRCSSSRAGEGPS